jgi:hypothetical protein
VHRGVCIAGPMAGLTINTRSDVGFVAVDAPGFAAWLYYIRATDGAYVLDTSPDASSLDSDGTRALDRERALAASQEKGLDVIALPGDGVEEDDPDDPDPGDAPTAVDLAPAPAEDVIAVGDPQEGED